MIQPIVRNKAEGKQISFAQNQISAIHVPASTIEYLKQVRHLNTPEPLHLPVALVIMDHAHKYRVDIILTTKEDMTEFTKLKKQIEAS